jgi:carboxymethylenebutenolidase
MSNRGLRSGNFGSADRAEGEAVNVQSKMVTVKTAEGRCRPISRSRRRRPVSWVVVVMEAFGLNAHIKDVADRIAREGYIVAAPDLYYRRFRRARVQLRRAAEGDPADDGPAGYDAIVGDVRATIALLESQPGIDAGQIGMTGFCMGGSSPSSRPAICRSRRRARSTAAASGAT